jgi:hypothetical protein
MRKTFAMALLVLVVGSGIGASSAGVAGATVSTNLASSCQPGASAAFNHSGTLHTYWAQVTLRCSVINKFTVTVKQNGTTMASLTKSYTNLNPAMPYPAVSSPNVPVVPGDRYQVVVTAIDASGGSLGYMTSGAPQVLVAAPAGGAISNEDMVIRADSWVAAKVPYSQTSSYTNAYGTYRHDCSGFVSMAWHLPSSLTTVTLPNVSHRLSSKSQLQPGDILLTSGHVVFFRNWSDAAHTLAVIEAEPHTGTVATKYAPQSVTSGWLADYAPYRFNNVF